MAIVGVIVSQITWYDTVTLADGATARVVNRDGNALVIRSAGTTTTIAADRCRTCALGLPSLVRQTVPHWILIALLLQAALPLFLAARWKLLLASAQHPSPYASVLLWQFRAQAIASLPIGQLGLDIVRAQQAVRAGYSIGHSISVVIFERLVGLAALLSLAAFGLRRLHLAGVVRLPEGTALLTCAVGAGGAILVLSVVCWLRRTRESALHGWLRQNVARWRRSGDRICRHPQALVAVLAATFAIHVTAVAIYVAADRSLSIGQPWSLYLIAVPVVQILLCLPNLNGLFITEGSMATFLVALGSRSVTEAVTLCAIVRVTDVTLRAVQVGALLLHSRAAGSPVATQSQGSPAGAGARAAAVAASVPS